MTPINTPAKTSITRPFLRPTFILIALALGCCALLPKAQAIVPPPDDGVPGFNTAAGHQAPQSLSDDKHTAPIPQGQSYVVTDLGGLGGNLGQIDEDELFYLRTRGIPTKVAQRLLVTGFLDEVIRRLDHPAIAEHLHRLIEEKFAK
jgi:SUF system FeS cluster assembly, SufBD